MPQRSDLPFGSEFSPSQISLSQLLEMASDHAGDVKGLQEAILVKYFASHAAQSSAESKVSNRNKLAMNCRLGMQAYGVIDESGALTELGKALYDIRHDETGLYRLFARHILLNLKGMAFVQCLRDMQAAGEEITLTTLRAALIERGVYYPTGGKHPSIMRLWLAKAGVLRQRSWQVDELVLEQVLAAEPDEFDTLRRLNPLQRAFLAALANTELTAPQPANQIVKLSVATYGVRFPEKSLPKEVLIPLVDAGYITISKTTEGRGAKPFLIAPTRKLQRELIEAFYTQLQTQVEPKLLDLLRKPLPEILHELNATDRYVAGLALEALAFKLMRLLDMTYVATRLRAQSTGGAEVDLIFESARLVFSRWQVQCKNTARVALDDVAKEVGLTHFLKSNVIVVVTTGEIGQEARRYANKIMTDSNICVIMINGHDLSTLSDNYAHIVDIFHREAVNAMNLKRLEAL
jgi:site-specific DNA-methyltransferase (cytosine-N4-specific)